MQIINKNTVEDIIKEKSEEISPVVEEFLADELSWQERHEDWAREGYDLPTISNIYELGYGEYICHAEDLVIEILWYNTRFQYDKVIVDGECKFVCNVIATKQYSCAGEDIDGGDAEFGPIEETIYFELTCDKDGTWETTDNCAIRREYMMDEGFDDRLIRDYFSYPH